MSEHTKKKQIIKLISLNKEFLNSISILYTPNYYGYICFMVKSWAFMQGYDIDRFGIYQYWPKNATLKCSNFITSLSG